MDNAHDGSSAAHLPCALAVSVSAPPASSKLVFTAVVGAACARDTIRATLMLKKVAVIAPNLEGRARRGDEVNEDKESTAHATKPRAHNEA